MKISVIVPAYNEEKMIGNCIDALLRQTLSKKEYEIIIVDNNSTDRTADIARKKGVNVVTYKAHQGTIWPRQFGISLAKGEIIAMTDADTYPESDWLENIQKLFQEEKLMCVGGSVKSNGSNKFTTELLEFSDLFSRQFQHLGIPILWSNNMAFRKSAFYAVNGFNTSLQTGEDWDFARRVQQKFGIRSVLYSSKLRVHSSPRKFESWDSFIPYVGVAFLNFFTVFVLRKSYTVGKYKMIR